MSETFTSAAHQRSIYPFAAVVGQEQMKLALLLNAVNPRLGGVLIRGEKGTAKSTAVRALAALLPEISSVAGCPYACEPSQRAGLCQVCQSGQAAVTAPHPVSFVELPVGATEDRVVGSIDLEQAITHGERRFEPGLLAAAHRGILYVDEVNLLNDHLVDVLLDAAAMGRNYVEREGVSIEHPAEFILVGTMNPEEGELRPQLLDRFALAVDVAGVRDQRLRAEVVRRRLAFERDPAGFTQQWQAETECLRAQVGQAQALLPQVLLDDRLLDLITFISVRFEVDGLRADIVMYKTAQTLAALAGRASVTEDDVRRAAELALPHRRRRQPFDRPELDPQQLQDAIDEWRHQNPPPAGGSDDPAGPDGADGNPGAPGPTSQDDPAPDHRHGRPPARAESSPAAGPAEGPVPAAQSPDQQPGSRQPKDTAPDQAPPEADPAPDRAIAPTAVPPMRLALAARPRLAETARGRRSTVRGAGLPGHYVAAQPPTGRVRDLALDATLRASAPHQQARRQAAAVLPPPAPTGGGPGRGRGLVLAASHPNPSPITHHSSQGSKRSTRHADIPRLIIRPPDLREKVREAKSGNLVLFVVDASGSMAARERLALAKGACVQLLQDAYQKRDRVGLIAFRGRDAQLLLPPTNSVDLAERRLRELPTGGRTPLGQGLRLGLQVIEQYRSRLAGYAPLLVVLSDWRPNVALTGDPIGEALAVAQEIAKRNLDVMIIDGEAGPVRLGLGRRIAATANAAYAGLDDLRSGTLTTTVKRLLRPAR